MGFGMTLDANVVHYMAVAIDNAEMTLLTIYATVNVVFVDERHVFVSVNKNFGFGIGVTGLAVRNFRVILFIIKMAVEAGCLGNREVLALNNLRVAADAF